MIFFGIVTVYSSNGLKLCILIIYRIKYICRDDQSGLGLPHFIISKKLRDEEIKKKNGDQSEKGKRSRDISRYVNK